MCPVDRRVSHTLIESLVNEVVVHDLGASERFQVKPVPVKDAIARALEDEAERVSSDLFQREPGLQGGVYTVKRSLPIEAELVGALRANLGVASGATWVGTAWPGPGAYASPLARHSASISTRTGLRASG